MSRVAAVLITGERLLDDEEIQSADEERFPSDKESQPGEMESRSGDKESFPADKESQSHDKGSIFFGKSDAPLFAAAVGGLAGRAPAPSTSRSGACRIACNDWRRAMTDLGKTFRATLVKSGAKGGWTYVVKTQFWLSPTR
jgi:hypothetical protein